VTADSAEAAVRVEGLRVNLAASGADIVDDVSFAIAPGEVLGLVGESGSGKTTVGLALLAHQRRGARIASGRVLIGGADLLALPPAQRRRMRGAVVSYVPQDPGAALNPARRIGAQLLDVLRVHDYGSGDTERRARLAQVMGEVSLPQDSAFLRRYPHELSGGQQQRVVIAMAFACKPSVVVLDEPTTGLDVTTQAHVLATIRRMTQVEGAAALYVSHDLSVVATLADRVAVMYAGRLVEVGSAAQLFAAAAHPYARLLLAAIPRLERRTALSAIPGRPPSPGARPPGCPFAPRCPLRADACDAALPELVTVVAGHDVRCLRVDAARTTIRAGDAAPAATGAGSSGEPAAEAAPAVPPPALEVAALNASYGAAHVVHDVSLTLPRHGCLALVGESGSGKTTVARSIVGLHTQWSGGIRLGEPDQPGASELANSAGHRSRAQRQAIQYIFQNPYRSLNPRRTVGQAVARPLTLLDVPRGQVRRRVGEMLERTYLPAAYARKYPDELSGGERQRVAIARALICQPSVLLCDEITSALDVSVQAAIVTLLRELQQELGLSLLFVTHNLPLVRAIAQQVVVLKQGRIVEAGDVGTVLDRPTEEYTRQLLADAPKLAAAPG
jgi:peptide/nickel transport system ATP-binding protein